MTASATSHSRASHALRLVALLLLTLLPACSTTLGLVGGSSGTEMCPGCRAEREITRAGWLTTAHSTGEVACPVWVALHVRDHEHAWVPIGCWSDAYGESCCVRHPVEGFASEEWLAYLGDLLPERVAGEVAEAMGDREAADAVVARVAAWRAARRTGTLSGGDDA